MPVPEKRDKDNDQAANTPADDAGIPDEDAYDDAETAREAREEAEKLDAIPYERLKKEDAGTEDE